MGKLWNRLLIKLGFRIDFDLPENAPPAWSTRPHQYRDTLNAGCCVECGGGSAHAIHHGKLVAPRPPAMNDEARKMLKHAPADHPMASFTLDD